MNSQASSSAASSSSSATSMPSKVIQTKSSDLVTINEKVNMTIEQNEVLRMICNSYEMTISEYMQQALVEAMRFDIEEGNFSDILLEKLGVETGKKETDFTQSNTLKDEFDKLYAQNMP
jgi:hypothetical protein